MTSTPNGCFSPDPDAQTKKSTPTPEDECRIVITESEIVIAIEAGDSLPVPWTPGPDTLSVSGFDDVSRKSDDPKHRHHRHHRRHHHERKGTEDNPLASRCESRLVVDDEFPSDCETVATTKSESVWSQRRGGSGSDHRKKKRRRKRKKKKRKRKPNGVVEEDEEDEDERRDKKAELIVVTVSAVILTIAILLIGITLALTPKIDEMGFVLDPRYNELHLATSDLMA
ncbi:uncharacterized protein LOC135385065 [Ornithodoros turicata]|uniref:uncharacterized protein LOC135385065 n=1 Tax=Ornithodoros turicata TaxID=34597 RepID=UPI0031396F18